jgi:uncharacterized protein (UPF0335 family)
MSTNGNGHGEIGHNSRQAIVDFVDRLERLKKEIKELSADYTDLFKEAASATGFNKSAIRNILKERETPPSDVYAVRVDEDALRRALGMTGPLLPPNEGDEERALVERHRRDKELAREARTLIGEMGGTVTIGEAAIQAAGR